MVYGKYGYVNVFNPATNWAGRDVIGIDTGISFLQAENLRSGGVWDAFMRHPAAQRALNDCRFPTRLILRSYRYDESPVAS